MTLHLPKEKVVHSVRGIYCPGANRPKIQYETEEKALNAIKFGNGDIIRAYYCSRCGCWHTTSKPDLMQPWEEMAEYITEKYHLDEVNEAESEQAMVYVKVVENKEIGKVILPSFFPIGILAKRFGYVHQVMTHGMTRMTDMQGYAVFKNGKVIIKQLKERDKEGFLQSFATRMEEEFEATNRYTSEYELFPKDIVLESDLDNEKEETVKAEEGGLSLSYVSQGLEGSVRPLEPQRYQSDFSQAQLEHCLRHHLGYYLEQLDLDLLDSRDSKVQYQVIAQRGAGLLQYAIGEYYHRQQALERVLSPSSLQLALGRLGFTELLDIDERLAAPFFSSLYLCATLQGQHDLRKKMEKTLTGLEKSVAARNVLRFNSSD